MIDKGILRRMGIATFSTFQEALRWYATRSNRSDLEIVKTENGYKCQFKGGNMWNEEIH